VHPEHHSPLVQACEVASAISVDRHQVAGKATVEPLPLRQFDHAVRRMRQIGAQPSDLLRSNRGPSDFYEEGTIVVGKKAYLLLCLSDSFQVNTLAVLCARSVEASLKVHDRKLSDRDRSPTRLRSRPSSRQMCALWAGGLLRSFGLVFRYGALLNPVVSAQGDWRLILIVQGVCAPAGSTPLTKWTHPVTEPPCVNVTSV
jgi:hypothetical protein